jgi:hypothetical protein
MDRLKRRGNSPQVSSRTYECPPFPIPRLCRVRSSPKGHRRTQKSSVEGCWNGAVDMQPTCHHCEHAVIYIYISLSLLNYNWGWETWHISANNDFRGHITKIWTNCEATVRQPNSPRCSSGCRHSPPHNTKPKKQGSKLLTSARNETLHSPLATHRTSHTTWEFQSSTSKGIKLKLN